MIQRNENIATRLAVSGPGESQNGPRESVSRYNEKARLLAEAGSIVRGFISSA
jgi:hypothetical protein